MKLLTVTLLVYALTVRFGEVDARPQVSDVQTTTKNSVQAASAARDRAVSAAKAANNVLIDSASQAGTSDYIIGGMLVNMAKAAAVLADTAARAASGDTNALSQFSNALRQLQLQSQLPGFAVNALRPGTDGIFGLLSGGGQLPISDTLSNGGPLIESIRTVVGTAGPATTAANAALSAVQAKTKAEVGSSVAAAQNAASEAENIAQQTQSTATSTDTIPGTQIISRIVPMVANAVAQATRAIAEFTNSVAERFRTGIIPSESGIVNGKQPSIVGGGFLNPFFR